MKDSKVFKRLVSVVFALAMVVGTLAVGAQSASAKTYALKYTYKNKKYYASPKGTGAGYLLTSVPKGAKKSNGKWYSKNADVDTDYSTNKVSIYAGDKASVGKGFRVGYKASSGAWYLVTYKNKNGGRSVYTWPYVGIAQ